MSHDKLDDRNGTRATSGPPASPEIMDFPGIFGRRDYDPDRAVLLLAHGTPNMLSEMAEYLSKVTGGRALPDAVVEELQHRYAQIGLQEKRTIEPPPLTRWTLKQAALLEDAIEAPVFVGMRNWHPYIADTIAEMRAEGITRFKAICLAPQNSRTSVGLYRRAVLSAAAEIPASSPSASYTPAQPMQVDFVAGWADHPLLAQAFAENLWPAWAEACAVISSQLGRPTRVPVLFTAHSVPCRTIMTGEASAALAARTSGSHPIAQPTSGSHPNTGTSKNIGSQPNPNLAQTPISAQTSAQTSASRPSAISTEPDPYPVEAKRTAQLVADRLAIVGLRPTDWYFAFQSQGISGGPWIGPTVEDTLKALKAEGHAGVVMQPIGFLCDHVEILYDIDIAFKQTAAELGLQLWRAESLNDSPTLTRALAEVATGTYQTQIEEATNPA